MPREELLPECREALTVWQLLDMHEREYWHADGMPLPLTLAAIRGAAADYHLGTQGRDLILALEHAVLPMRQEEHRERRRRGEKAKA